MSKRPVIPVHVELPIAPVHDGRFVEVSFSKLGDSLTWLSDAVDTLSKGLRNVHQHLKDQEELWKRLENLENKPPPEATVIKEAPPPPVKIEIPYIPSNDDIAGIALKTVTPVIEAKVAELQGQVDDKIATLQQRVKTLEDIEANRKDPFARMQKYFQEIGFLPYGEPDESDPLVLLGQVFVLLRQDIAKCPTIKDLENAEAALRDRIAEVESTAKADREEKARIAAAESAKIREDLEKISKKVEALIQKNIDDGDLAGALRDLTIRVDKIEDLLRKKENEKKEPEPVVVEQKPREKGFLEKLAEVDLQEEVRRLRSMVECMEAAMPYETRQTMEYLRSGKAPPGREASPTSPTRNMESTMLAGQSTANMSGTLRSDGVDLRQETEDQLLRFKQTQGRELQSVMKVLKNQEKTIEALEAKVLDLWKRLPKVLALLEPLQAQMETMNNDMYLETVQDSTGGGPNKNVTFATEGDTGSDINTTNLSTTNIFVETMGDNGKGTDMPSPPISQSVPPVSNPPIGQGPKGQLPTVQPPTGWTKGKDKPSFLTGFLSTMDAVDKGTGGTGEVGGPLKEMGSLTGLIKMALQRTTDDIHADLRQQLLRLRQEMLARLDLKADKTELQALLSRIDELSKRSKRIKEFPMYSKDRERSVSPPLDRSAGTRNDANSDVRQGSPPSPGVPLTTSATSPNLSERKKGHSCHENCKVPTCPKAMQMTQSLSRLPALKVVQ